jgi:hypothetical protein
MKTCAKTTGALDFPAKIRAILDRVQERPGMYASPKRLEFGLCARLAAWEALTLHDARSYHWLQVWQEHCGKLHHGRTGLTLADPVGKPGLRQRWGVSQSETTKAYQRVLDGLRRVYQDTLAHYHQSKLVPLASNEQAASILGQLITESFHQARSFAEPEGLESYLLTLIELFEWSLGQDPSKLCSRERWQQEIQRKRSLGPPATRTLADVTSLDVRLARAKALLPNERAAILSQIIKSMHQIVKQLDTYLVDKTP